MRAPLWALGGLAMAWGAFRIHELGYDWVAAVMITASVIALMSAAEAGD